MSARPFDFFLVSQLQPWAQDVAAGSRFQFRSPDAVNAECLYLALCDKASGQIEVDSVLLPYLLFGKTKIVPVLQHPGVRQSFSENYISFLRDELSKQRELDGCALLIIHNSLLDTLINNAGDLASDKGVWSRDNVRKNLTKMIREDSVANRRLSECLLNYQFDALCEDGATVFGFEPLFRALQDGELRFNELNLLPDPLITDAEISDERLIRNRLDENRELFQKIQREVEEFPHSIQMRFKDRFSEGFIKEVFPEGDLDSWKTISFQKFRDDEKESSKQALVYEKAVLNGKLMDVIDRAQSDRAAGARKRHLLLLADTDSDEVELRISFEGQVLERGQVRVDIATSSMSVDVSRSGKRSFIKVQMKIAEKPEFFRISTTRNRASEKYEFHGLLLRKGWFYVEGFRNHYLVDSKQQQLRLETDAEVLDLCENGRDSKQITSPGESINGLAYGLVDFSRLANESDKVEFRIERDERHLDFFVKSEPASERLGLPLLLDSERAGKLFNDNYNGRYDPRGRVTLDNREYEVVAERHVLLRREHDFIQNRHVARSQIGGAVTLDTLKQASEEIGNAYENLFSYLESAETLLSLASWGPSLREVVQSVVSVFYNYLSGIKEHTVLTESEILVINSGLLEEDGIEYLSPYHPLILAYYLYLAESAAVEDERSFSNLPKITLERLSPRGLLPFVYDEKNGFAHVQSNPYNAFWLKLVPRAESSYEFVRLLIKEKLIEFKEAFGLLFSSHPHSEMILNAVNSGNAREILLGLVEFFKSTIARGESEPTPVHINFYDEELQFNEFDLFSEITETTVVKEMLGLEKGAAKASADTIIDLLRTRMTYSKFTHQNSDRDFGYAHVTFVKDDNRVDRQSIKVRAALSGVAAGGLINGEASENKGGAYYTAFGLRRIKTNNRPHLQLAELYNSLWLPARKPGAQYTGSDASAIAVNVSFQDLLRKCYDSSVWTTLIDPKVTLDFFDTQSGVLLIHYSDQYTNSASYDAVTVTREAHLYRKVLEPSAGVGAGSLIKEFNAFNGLWLLQMLTAHKNEQKGIKGVIGAYKFATGLVINSDITWVPFSVAELVRVAAHSGLKLDESEFSRFVQGYRSGVISDDVLLVGLKDQQLYLLPVEVKAGSSPDYDKAERQSRELKRYLKEDLLMPRTLAGCLYRSLFVRQVFVQIDKYRLYDVFEPEYFNFVLDQREEWLRGEYTLAEIPSYPEGFVVAFVDSETCFEPSYTQKSEILRIELPFGLLADLVAKPLQQLTKVVELPRLCNVPSEYVLNGPIKDRQTEVTELENPNSEPESVTADKATTDRKRPSSLDGPDVNDADRELKVDTRLLIGKSCHKGKPVFWEYGNPELPNRHLLIFGRSGEGKTYCIQGLILELANKQINSLVIDYTNGFLPEHLEPEFNGSVSPKTHLVAHEPLKLNPFKRQSQLIAGINIEDKPHAVAGRVASVFNSVYSTIGEQQIATLISVIEEGVARCGNDYQLTDMLEALSEYGKVGEALANKLNPLIKASIFKGDESSGWNPIFDDAESRAHIVQLATIPKDISRLATEFILWDLYSYASKFGSKLKPLPIILDEVQNLDHGLTSPLGKMLTEGRKYGVSLILATQTLSNLAKDEQDRLFQASHKLFFAPAQTEIKKYADILENSVPGTKQREWIGVLSSLKKGQCLSVGYHQTHNNSLEFRVEKIDVAPLSARVL